MILPSHRGDSGRPMRSRLPERTTATVYTQRRPPLLLSPFPPSLPIPPSLVTTPSTHLSSTSQPFTFLYPAFNISPSQLLLSEHNPHLPQESSHVNPLHTYLEKSTFTLTLHCTSLVVLIHFNLIFFLYEYTSD